MIVKVWGELNGIGMIPVNVIGDRYYFQLPPTLTGKFVCQFWAEDDYGNVSYESALLTLSKGMVKCIEVLTRDWAVTMLSDGMSMEIEPDTWNVQMLPITCRNDMMEVLM